MQGSRCELAAEETSTAITSLSQGFEVVTAIYLQRGAPPEKPTSMRLLVLRLSICGKRGYVKGRGHQTKRQLLIQQAQASEIDANINQRSGVLGVTPRGYGRFLVRPSESMSRSLYPVRVSAAADPAATPPSKSIHVNRVIGTSNRNEAVSAAPNAVKTSRYQILGFVSS